MTKKRSHRSSNSSDSSDSSKSSSSSDSDKSLPNTPTTGGTIVSKKARMDDSTEIKDSKKTKEPPCMPSPLELEKFCKEVIKAHEEKMVDLDGKKALGQFSTTFANTAFASYDLKLMQNGVRKAYQDGAQLAHKTMLELVIGAGQYVKMKESFSLHPSLPPHGSLQELKNFRENHKHELSHVQIVGLDQKIAKKEKQMNKPASAKKEIKVEKTPYDMFKLFNKDEYPDLSVEELEKKLKSKWEGMTAAKRKRFENMANGV